MFLYGGFSSKVVDSPAKIGMTSLYKVFFHPKNWIPQPKWLDLLLYGDFRPKLWTPQPNRPDMFVYGDLCIKLWTLLPNWLKLLRNVRACARSTCIYKTIFKYLLYYIHIYFEDGLFTRLHTRRGGWYSHTWAI